MTKTKPGEARGLERIDKASGEAAAALARELELCSEAMKLCVNVWAHAKTKDSYVVNSFLSDAMALAKTSAQLAETIAKMKAETRQHISVERLAPPREAASIAETLSTREALKQRAKSKRSSQIEGEGGGD
jgi:hypothetical protein